MTPQVLVVDDDPMCLNSLTEYVRGQDFRVTKAESLKTTRQNLKKKKFDLVLLDLNLPDGHGMEIVREMDLSNGTRLVVVTANNEVESAVEAMRNGAFDYLTKPIDMSRLKKILKDVQKAPTKKTSTARKKRATTNKKHAEIGIWEDGPLVAKSQAMVHVLEMIERVAKTEAPVFIIGESGTGKELVAQSIHDKSHRSGGEFVAINCGAISPNLIESELFGHERGSFTGAQTRRIGYFEQANGGTLFLDEITEMPLELQVKLLRVLETGTFQRVGGTQKIDVNVRILAATNRQPEEAIRAEKFRKDLYFRLNVFPIEIAPVRERVEDIDALSQYFLEQLNELYRTKKKFGPGVTEKLREHSWPGNVRELKNAIHRAYIMSDKAVDLNTLEMITDDQALSPPASSSFRVGSTIEEIETEMILATLKAYHGNKPKAAKVLGISLKTLYNRINHFSDEDKGEAGL